MANTDTASQDAPGNDGVPKEVTAPAKVVLPAPSAGFESVEAVQSPLRADAFVLRIPPEVLCCEDGSILRIVSLGAGRPAAIISSDGKFIHEGLEQFFVERLGISDLPNETLEALRTKGVRTLRYSRDIGIAFVFEDGSEHLCLSVKPCGDSKSAGSSTVGDSDVATHHQEIDLPELLQPEDHNLPQGFRPKPEQSELPAFVSIAASYGLSPGSLRAILQTTGNGALLKDNALAAEETREVEKVIQSLGLVKHGELEHESRSRGSANEAKEPPRGGATFVSFTEFNQRAQARLIKDTWPIKFLIRGSEKREGFVVVMSCYDSRQNVPAVITIVSSIEEQLQLYETLESHALQLMDHSAGDRGSRLIFSGADRYYITPTKAHGLLEFQVLDVNSTHHAVNLILSRLGRPPSVDPDPFFIISEPHQVVEGHVNLYRGLTQVYEANHHWFGDNTVFVVEGFDRGKEIDLNVLRSLDPHPSEETLAKVADSLLLPGQLVFLWAHNPPIRAVGSEDSILYEASVRLSIKLGELPPVLPGLSHKELPSLSTLAWGEFLMKVWHTVVFARNASMVEEVKRLEASGARPILFVGQLHLDVKWWNPLQAFFAKESSRRNTLLTKAQDHGLLTKKEVEILREVKGGPVQSLLEASTVSKPIYYVSSRAVRSPESEAPLMQRYHALMLAQSLGRKAVKEHISEMLSREHWAGGPQGNPDAAVYHYRQT